MQKVQHETGKVLNIGVVNRFNKAVNMVKDYVDAGKLGEVYHVYCSFRAHRSIPGLGGPFTTKELAGGGVLIDWGVHYLDLINYVLGIQECRTFPVRVIPNWPPICVNMSTKTCGQVPRITTEPMTWRSM